MTYSLSKIGPITQLNTREQMDAMCIQKHVTIPHIRVSPDDVLDIPPKGVCLSVIQGKPTPYYGNIGAFVSET